MNRKKRRPETYFKVQSSQSKRRHIEKKMSYSSWKRECHIGIVVRVGHDQENSKEKMPIASVKTVVSSACTPKEFKYRIVKASIRR
jgi:hypothetical protein